MFHENAKRASSTPVSKKRATWKLDQKSIRCFSEANAEEEQKIRNFAITESRNGRFSNLMLQTKLRYAEMIRITKRKRFGQRLRMIICLRESRKNANIGDQFSKLTRRKTFKDDEIVISPKRKTPRHSGPLSNFAIFR